MLLQFIPFGYQKGHTYRFKYPWLLFCPCTIQWRAFRYFLLLLALIQHDMCMKSNSSQSLTHSAYNNDVYHATSVEIREIIPATSYRQDIHNSIIYKRICKWLNYGILRLGYGSHANCDKLHLMWNPLNYVTASLFTTHMINWKSSVDDDTSCMFRIYFIHITYIHIFMFMLV